MATVYLHGGMPKTGTTYIQQFLKDNSEILKENGAVFPDFSDLFPEIYHDGRDSIAVRRNGYWLNKVSWKEEASVKVLERIGTLAGQYEKIILSDEMLWNRKFNRDAFWQLFQKHLKIYGIELKAVFYLRRQDAFIYSIWAQHIKTMRDAPYQTYTLKQFLDEDFHNYYKLDYLSVLETMERQIGRENMIPRVFEIGQFGGGAHTLLSDFFEAVDLPLTDAYRKPAQLQNESLKDSVLEAKRHLNQVTEFRELDAASRKDFADCLLLAQKALEDKGCLQDRTAFPNTERSRFLRDYEAGNAALAKKYFDREKLFLDEIPDTDVPEEEFTTEELMVVCGQVMLQMLDKISGQRSRRRETAAKNKLLQLENKKLRERALAAEKEISRLRKKPLRALLRSRSKRQ